MKKSNIQNIRLGIFVIVGTILFVVTFYLLGQNKNMFGKTSNISSIFQNVNGLKVGNNVRYAGIDIGTVEEIMMINDTSIKVNMIIEEEIMSHIKKNAIATISSDGLVGNMIVNIVPGSGDMASITNGDQIQSYSKIGTDDILNTLNTTNENAAMLTADLLKITHTILEGKGTLGTMLNDSIMANDLKESIAFLKQSSLSISKTMIGLDQVIRNITHDKSSAVGVLLNDSASGNKISTIITNLENSSQDIDKSLQNINEILEDIDNEDGAINYLSSDTSLVNNLKSTIDQVNEGTDNFNQVMEALKHNFLTRRYFKKLEKNKK